MKLLMKWAQIFNNYQTLHQEDQWLNILSSSVVFYVLSRHSSLITDKGFNLFDECAARCVHLFPQEKECTSSFWGYSKMYTFGSTSNSQRMLAEINESGTIAKIRIIYSEKWYCQTLNAFRIISTKMKISLLIIILWCCSSLHIQTIGIQIQISCFEK